MSGIMRKDINICIVTVAVNCKQTGYRIFSFEPNITIKYMDNLTRIVGSVSRSHIAHSTCSESVELSERCQR